MANILMVVASSYGQTARIVDRIAAVLLEGGHSVRRVRADHLPAKFSTAEFDGVILAGSVLFGRHQDSLFEFAKGHLDELNALPSFFVSVSGAAGKPDPAAQAEARKYRERFLRRTGWHPDSHVSFGGALAYTQYGWLTRRMMQWISRRSGGPTDASQDYEFTDWRAVERFASGIGQRFGPATGTEGRTVEPELAAPGGRR